MRNTLLLAALTAAIMVSAAFAQRRTPGNQSVDSETKIFIGQTLADAKKALSGRQIEFGEGGFALRKWSPDGANLFAHIDENHTSACIYYSKSRSQVTRLDMVFSQSRQSNGADRVWLSATELQLNADRTYSVKFKAPLTDEELRKLEEDRPAQSSAKPLQKARRKQK